MKPTPAQIAAYQLAFDHFNALLFDGKLPHAVLNFSRHAGANGFFAAERWYDNGASGQKPLHEISLNPDLLLREPIEYYSTLVHEMAHHWQQCFGGPSRNGYHNKQWAQKMVEIGLIPSATGEPGGKTTGQRMTHYIAPAGPFEAAFRSLPPEALLPYVSGQAAREPRLCRPRQEMYRYACQDCQTQLRAPTTELQARCWECHHFLKLQPDL